jgi:hypothetical protein
MFVSYLTPHRLWWGRIHTFICELLDVQYSNLDPSLREQVHNNLANSVGSTSDDYNLLTPHICVVVPVIGDCIIEPCTDTPEQT